MQTQSPEKTSRVALRVVLLIPLWILFGPQIFFLALAYGEFLYAAIPVTVTFLSIAFVLEGVAEPMTMAQIIRSSAKYTLIFYVSTTALIVPLFLLVEIWG